MGRYFSDLPIVRKKYKMTRQKSIKEITFIFYWSYYNSWLEYEVAIDVRGIFNDKKNMAYSNIVRSIPLSIALFVVLSKAHQICNNTSECPDEYFCDIYLNNNNELSQSECKPCITCTDYNRQSISICSEGIQQCGPCQTGFTYTSASVTDCVAIDNQKTKCNNCEITPTGISKVTTTDIILVFLLILPVSGVVVIGITLFIGYIYKKHIQKKSLVNDQYFHYRIINL